MKIQKGNRTETVDDAVAKLLIDRDGWKEVKETKKKA
jgi:hypothetical protein